MDRREALKALLALPAVKDIAVADVKPNDVIVLEAADTLTAEQIDIIRTQVGRVWPGRQVVVMSGGLRMKIARDTA